MLSIVKAYPGFYIGGDPEEVIRDFLKGDRTITSGKLKSPSGAQGQSPGRGSGVKQNLTLVYNFNVSCRNFSI